MKTESRQMQKIKLAKGKSGKTRVCLCEGVVCGEYNAYLCKHLSLSCKPRSAHECR